MVLLLLAAALGLGLLLLTALGLGGLLLTVLGLGLLLLAALGFPALAGLLLGLGEGDFTAVGPLLAGLGAAAAVLVDAAVLLAAAVEMLALAALEEAALLSAPALLLSAAAEELAAELPREGDLLALPREGDLLALACASAPVCGCDGSTTRSRARASRSGLPLCSSIPLPCHVGGGGERHQEILRVCAGRGSAVPQDRGFVYTRRRATSGDNAGTLRCEMGSVLLERCPDFWSRFCNACSCFSACAGDLPELGAGSRLCSRQPQRYNSPRAAVSRCP